MKLIKLLVLSLFILPLTAKVSAQIHSSVKNTNTDFAHTPWTIGLGYNFVSDDGAVYSNFLKMKDRWNGLSYPTRLSGEKYIGSGFSLQAVVALNQYKVGKIVDGTSNTTTDNYFSMDLLVKFGLLELFGTTSKFDPFVLSGYGYSWKSTVNTGTYNLGLGFNFWFTDNIGLSLESMGKWSGIRVASNHSQHAIGMVYKFHKNQFK